MIARITRVRDFRAFKDWRPSPDLPNFSQVNLVYGINATGKSTLASLLREAASDDQWASGLEIEATAVNGGKRTVRAATDTLWNSLRVFNRDYVQANLEFEEQSGSTAVPLLVLGEARIEVEKETARIDARLAEITEALAAARTKVKKVTTDRESQATSCARVIGEELSTLGGLYSPRRYTAASVKKRLAAWDDGGTVESASVAADLALVKATSVLELQVPHQSRLSLADVGPRVEAILARTPLSEPLPELASSSERSEWAQHGVRLHADQSKCLFCGGEISDDRRQALARHFDKSLRDMQTALTALEQDISTLVGGLEQMIRELPRTEELVSSERKNYREATDRFQQGAKQSKRAAAALTKLITAKRRNPFSDGKIDAGSVEFPEINIRTISEILNRHNNTATDFDVRRREAAARIEHARIAEMRDSYIEKSSEIATKNSEIDALTREAEELTDRRLELGQRDLDPLPIARQLNEDLAHLLGRSDIQFTLKGTGYGLTRDKRPARDLSEGERNAISLLYFLRSLGTHGTTAKDCIVIVDDPSPVWTEAHSSAPQRTCGPGSSGRPSVDSCSC